MNRRFWRHLEDKTRANDQHQAEQRWKAALPSVELLQPPLLVVLRHDLGKLPAGIVIQFPYDVAVRLLNRRGYAVPVGSFDAQPGLIVDEEQLMYAGLPPSVIPMEAILETAVEAA